MCFGLLRYIQNSYPRDAINAGIATAISPTAAVAVSNDVLITLKLERLFYTEDLTNFVSIITN